MIHIQWYRQQASACSAAGRWSRSTPRRWSETSLEFAARLPQIHWLPGGSVSSGCWIRHRRCRWGWAHWLWRCCRRTWCSRSSPVISPPTFARVALPPIPALPLGLPSRAAWIRSIWIPLLPSVPSTATLKGLVAILTALPALNSLLKDWSLMSVALPLCRLLDRVKMTSVSLSSFSRTRLCRSCQRELCHIRCCGLFHHGMLLAFDVVKLLVPLTFCKVDQVEKAVLSRLLVNRHHRTWPSKQRRRGFPPRFQQVCGKHGKLRKCEDSSMMSHHCFFCDIQWKPDISVEVWHENQSSADTCSQLLFSLFSGTAEVRGNTFC